MKANARFARNDDAAAEVVGTILLVGITVVMMVGLSLMMLSLDGPRDQVHIDVRMAVLPGGNGWGTGDEVVRIEHVGGEPLPEATARIRVTVGDATFAAAGADLGQGFADGSFKLGDTWQRVQMIQEGDAVELLLIDDAGNAVTNTARLTAKGTGSSTGGGGGVVFGEVTYVATGIAAKGTLSNFAAMQNASDAGAVATLSESSSGGVPATVTRSPSSVATSTGVTNPANALASNDNRATMGAGANLELTGFSLGATDVVINSVRIGMEAQRGTGTGSGSSISLSYEIGGVAGPTAGTHVVTATSDTHYTTMVTSDRTWTSADISSLTVVAERVSGGRATQIDHVYITVSYTTVLVTDAEATFGFTGVPAGSNQLQLRHRTAIETFDLQVWNGATWNNRGILNSPLSFSVFTYTLQAGEFNGGAPQVRIVDRDTGSVAGEVRIDYMRMDTT